MSLKVTGKETVEVAAGSFETYRVEIEPLDGEPGGMVLNVGLKPRCVIKNNAKLPAAMGGGTMLVELSSIGEVTAK